MGTPKWVGTTGALIEQANSPVTESSDRWARTRIFKAPYALALSSALPKGTLGTGDEAGWVVARSSVAKERGGVGVLTIVYEAGDATSGAELPPIKFGTDPHRLPRALAYHPRYVTLTDADRENVEKALQGNTVEGNAAFNAINVTGKELALDLYRKRRRGQESYYLNGLRYFYTQGSWTMPSLTLGGFIDVPDGPMDGALPADTVWLREPDDFKFTGSYFETTRSWIGVPTGDWDSDIY